MTDHEHHAPLVFDRDAPTNAGRRRALAAMAASLALASGACSRMPRERIYPWVHMPEARGGGLPMFYASAYARDGYAHGVLIGTQEGRPTKIEGNPEHPASLGATDVFAQASVLELWDPDRASVVMQGLGERTAARSNGDARADGRSADDRSAAHAFEQAASNWAEFETAWHAQAQNLRARRGEGLFVATGPLTSPTARAQLAALLAHWPRARWIQYAPSADASALQGAQRAFGRPVEVVAHADRAQCIVAFGGDPFSDGPGALRFAADWAARRSADRETDRAAASIAGRAAAPVNGRAEANDRATANNANPRSCAPPFARLIAVEATPGLFGARADARLALPPSQIDALVVRVAVRVLTNGAAADAGSTDDRIRAFEDRLVAALEAAGPNALMLPGACLSPASHALVHAMHERLGAFGRTLDPIAPLALASEAGSLGDLVAAMDAGIVRTLWMLDVNPVYDTPDVLGFANALRKVPFSVHAGLHRDETARACDWHLPLTHAYEQWSDARAFDGTISLVQPAIDPLYDTRSLHELLALIGEDDEQDGHRLVLRQWRAGRAGDAFDAFWRTSLQRGVVDGSAAPSLANLRVRANAIGDLTRGAPAAAPRKPDVLEAVFTTDPSTHDGRYANNGWLQELPRPFTKLTWDNALLLGPKTAQRLNLRTGDVVRASIGTRAVDAPVWVANAHAEDTVTLPLGYGHRSVGRVGDKVGFDAYFVRPHDAPVADARLRALNKRVDFAVTQHEIDQHERELARTVARGAAADDRSGEQPSLYARHPNPVHAWGMVIDLDACIGCNACTIACQAENNIPVVGPAEVARGREMHWIRVDRYETGEVEGSVFQPVPCMHCENAPCEVVCPVGATVHDNEGLNVQVYNRCVGTRFCSNNCPYKVRRFNFLQYADAQTETLKAQRNPEVTVRARGVMEKCNYCMQRVARGRQHEQRTGTSLADGDVVTACQAVCPTRAIRFGDLNDANSDVVKAKASPRHYALLGELNTRPRTTYLARVRDDDDPG